MKMRNSIQSFGHDVLQHETDLNKTPSACKRLPRNGEPTSTSPKRTNARQNGYWGESRCAEFQWYYYLPVLHTHTVVRIYVQVWTWSKAFA